MSNDRWSTEGEDHHQGLARSHRLSDGSIHFFLTHSELDTGDQGSVRSGLRQQSGRDPLVIGQNPAYAPGRLPVLPTGRRGTLLQQGPVCHRQPPRTRCLRLPPGFPAPARRSRYGSWRDDSRLPGALHRADQLARTGLPIAVQRAHRSTENDHAGIRRSGRLRGASRPGLCCSADSRGGADRWMRAGNAFYLTQPLLDAASGRGMPQAHRQTVTTTIRPLPFPEAVALPPISAATQRQREQYRR
jgi:hypothetical protein